MAHRATHFPANPLAQATGALRRGLAALRARAWRSLEAYAEARSRRPQIEALNALSDAELAAIGLKRHQIVAFVVRDQMHR